MRAALKIQDIRGENLGIVGNSPEIQEIREIIHQVAPTDITVLITGESGTGKEVIARAVHSLSKRSTKAMVTVNCGAIPEGIIESELFGHEKGAFTSAVETRKGYFEIADGGTIFLDEIGETPVATQVKLLRVIENGEFMRVGASIPRTTDVRVIAATNKNLEHEVQQKRFRADLYFRLRSVNLWIPPLRHRREDIPLLIEHFMEEFSQKSQIASGGISPDAIEELMRYPWPGNVRELRNIIESMIVLENGKRITAEEIRRYLPNQSPQVSDRHLPVVTSKTVEQAERELIYRALLDLKKDLSDLKEYLRNVGTRSEPADEEPAARGGSNGAYSLDAMEQDMITKALERHRGNRRMAARELNISERTLYRKIKEYGLNG
jgi:transcriptional regulator with PAS, ATPase and Fis domain